MLSKKTAGNHATTVLQSSTKEYSSMNLLQYMQLVLPRVLRNSSHNADQVYASAVLPPKSTVHNEGRAKHQKEIIWPTV